LQMIHSFEPCVGNNGQLLLFVLTDQI